MPKSPVAKVEDVAFEVKKVIRPDRHAIVIPKIWPILPLVPFDIKHGELNGAPGSAPSPDAPPEAVADGFRVRYQNGTIYKRPDGGCAWVYGAIGDRYDELGGPTSWLGFPQTDEMDFNDGRISVFDHGSIYWWDDVGAIDLGDVVVHYTGLLCFGETNDDGDFTPLWDEPYVVLGAVSPQGGVEVRSQIYTNVDGGDVRPDLIELYRGKPAGLAVSALLMEHDFGDPDHFRSEVDKFVTEASDAIEGGLEYVPVFGPLLSKGAEKILTKYHDDIVDFINHLLDTGDDVLGNDLVTLSAKQMVVLAARTQNDDRYGVQYKVVSTLISAQGASYKVCFGVVPT